MEQSDNSKEKGTSLCSFFFFYTNHQIAPEWWGYGYLQVSKDGCIPVAIHHVPCSARTRTDKMLHCYVIGTCLERDVRKAIEGRRASTNESSSDGCGASQVGRETARRGAQLEILSKKFEKLRRTAWSRIRTDRLEQTVRTALVWRAGGALRRSPDGIRAAEGRKSLVCRRQILCPAMAIAPRFTVALWYT